MRRADLRRFHDLASSTKTRGQGIGFAGVGIKLGLLVSDEVITESRRGKEHVSTTWMLSTRRRAPWHWMPAAGLVAERSTPVRLRLSSALSPVVDSGFLESAIRRHFEPLLDPFFDDVLRTHYPSGIRFEIDGRDLARAGVHEREGACGRRGMPDSEYGNLALRSEVGVNIFPLGRVPFLRGIRLCCPSTMSTRKIEFHGFHWGVFEPPAKPLPSADGDRPGSPGLYFLSRAGSRRTDAYPENWASLSDRELASLCAEARSIGEHLRNV